MLIAFVVMFSTFALAIPTVEQVETSISKGDYTTAKKQLGEVLAIHPDALVANKYMLEIIKIEYAKTQTPSVEYKLYENRIATINTVIAKEKARLAKIDQDRKDAVKAENVKLFLKWMVALALLVMVGTIFYFGTKRILIHRRNILQQLQEKEVLRIWVGDTRAALLDMNKFITITQAENNDWENRYPKLKFLLDDTLMYLEELKCGAFNGEDIDRHFENAEDYFKKVGLI